MFGSSFGGELERSERNEEVERGDSGKRIMMRFVETLSVVHAKLKRSEWMSGRI